MGTRDHHRSEAVVIAVGAVALINGYVTLDGKAVAVLATVLAVYAVVLLRTSIGAGQARES